MLQVTASHGMRVALLLLLLPLGAVQVRLAAV